MNVRRNIAGLLVAFMLFISLAAFVPSADDPLLSADRQAVAEPFDAVMFAKTFSHRTIQVANVSYHVVIGGHGPVVVLPPRFSGHMV